MKSALIMMAFVVLSGCSWIAVDHYYESKESISGWSSEFRPGKSSTKNAGYPDAMIFSFSRPEFTVSLNVDYQNVISVGPIIFPVIPTPWKHTGELTLEATITTDSEVEVDLSKWQVSRNGKSRKIGPKEIFVPGYSSGSEWSEPSPLTLKNDSIVYVRYPLKAADIESINIAIGGFKTSGGLVKPPELNLVKTSGDWHFEQFTL